MSYVCCLSFHYSRRSSYLFASWLSLTVSPSPAADCSTCLSWSPLQLALPCSTYLPSTSDLFLTGSFWAPVDEVFPVHKFMEEVKWISVVVGLVTTSGSAGRVEILFSGRLAGSRLGWGRGNRWLTHTHTQFTIIIYYCPGSWCNTSR
jgi:hypothetical protein